MDKNIIKDMVVVANDLDNRSLYKEANDVMKVMEKIAYDDGYSDKIEDMKQSELQDCYAEYQQSIEEMLRISIGTASGEGMDFVGQIKAAKMGYEQGLAYLVKELKENADCGSVSEKVSRFNYMMGEYDEGEKEVAEMVYEALEQIRDEVIANNMDMIKAIYGAWYNQ